MKNGIIYLQKITLLLILLTTAAMAASAQTLNGDGSTYTINSNGSEVYLGSAQDYTIPSNPVYNTITFELLGGSGGSAVAGLFTCASDGGKGATTIASFLIGNGTNELNPGGTIRFIVGKIGSDGYSAEGSTAKAGSGGGGTAVLYRPDGMSDWVILAVAGGGGGAHQGNILGSCVDSQLGQGGRATENGGDGDGDGTNGGDGGTNGGAGGDGEQPFSTEVSYGGGGATGSNADAGGHEGYPDGGRGGYNTSENQGGWGFGGGGAASNSGGGGGGYSGGGGGADSDNGGGGGSYVNTVYALSDYNITAGADGGSVTNGFVKYQFISRTLEWTGAIDHNWHDSGNWLPNYVPTSADIVEINAAVNDPYIWPGSPAEARVVRVLSGGELTVQSNGILNLYPLNSNGISNYGTIINMGGEVNIARYAGNANNDGILNEGGFFRNMSGGEINIEGMDGYGILNMAGATFDNQTASTINIGTVSSQIGNDGIRNETGSDFDNFGILNIRNTGSHGISNSGDFTNTPDKVININQTTGSAIQCLSGTFTNTGYINIGELATIGAAGIGLYSAATFINNTFGIISIWRATTSGVYIELGTVFENRDKLYIGGLGGTGIAGDAAVVIDGTFTNFSGGQLFADQTVGDGVAVGFTGSFNNYQNITIGSITTTGGNGIEIHGIFNNYSAGNIFIIRSGNHGIYNPAGIFTNEGLIEIGENGNIGSAAIYTGSSGGEADFYNNSCTGIYLFDKNIVDEEDRFINSGTILQESSASSYINTNNGTIFYNAGSFTVGSGNAPVSISGTFANKKLWTACDGNSWANNNNWFPSGIPTTTDEVIIGFVGTNPVITTVQTGQSKSVYIEDGARLFNNGTLHVTDGDFTLVQGGSTVGPGQYLISGDFIVSGGTFLAGLSTVTLNGTGNQHISPDPVTFYKLEIDKPSGDALIGMGSIRILNELNMVSGNIDLNGYDIELLSNGTIMGEDADSYIYSTSGGVVKKTLDLNAPTAVNPGNIGASITSSANLGSTTIQRGHEEQSVNGQASIFRYYDISPATNTGLSATLRFHYLEHELNGIAKNELTFYRFNGANWDNYTVNVADANANWVETDNINAFSRWTLTADCNANSIFYADTDGDGYGDPLVTIMDCAAPAGYVTDNTDCNDGDADEFPGQTWYEDADNDGYTTGNTETACERPTGYKLADELASTAFMDCNDMNDAIHPGATESCNGIDDNCNSQADEGVQSTFYADTDGDGYGDPLVTIMDCAAPTGYVTDNTDCNDGDADEFPGQTWYEDADNDGYTTGNTETACERPTGYKLADELANTTDMDCNDMNDAIHPGATESCNGIDDNCNNQADEGIQSTYYADTDGDGYGDPLVTVMDCTTPTGYVTDNTDCNDGDADEFPNQTWYEDADNDGYTTGNTETACERPTGYKLADELANTTDIDCNDMNDAIHPGATESCNGIDDNCNSQTDEGVQSTFYADSDGDGYGDPLVTIMDCAAPAGYVTDNTDCNDGDADEFPGQIWYIDMDGDGHGGSSITSCERPGKGFLLSELMGNGTDDCADGNAFIHPSAIEICDGLDNDCDGLVDIADNDLASTWAYSDVSNIAGAAGSAIFDPCEIGGGEVTLSFYSPSQNTAVDNHGYLHTELCGDGEVSFKVESTSNNAYVGLTMRESLDPAAKQVSLFSNLTNMLRWETRYTDGAPVQVNSFFKPGSYWIKLKRQGDWIFGYYSAMGYNWSIVHAVYVPMNECIEAGISIWPFSPGATETVTVSNVYFTEYGGTNSEPELPEVEIAETNTRWSLYPNPASNHFTLQLDSPLQEEAMVEVINLYGQSVAVQQLPAGQIIQNWNVADWPAGTYMLRLNRAGQAPLVKQFVVSR